jgi:DNA polymerase-3 subunit alpha
VKFVDGSVEKGVKADVAEAIFKQFEEFAAYGFNKSHAACYALIAYQTAYLKAHWPAAFMAALLNSDCLNIERVQIEVEECRRMGLPVLAPDVNESFTRFAIVKGKFELRFGLLAVKGMGEDVAEYIIQERKAGGSYKDLADFVKRMKHKSFNRRSLEALIRCGALDRFEERNRLYFNIDTLLDYHKQEERETESGQFNLFGAMGSSTQTTLQLKTAPPATQREKLSWEKELLGLYVAAHPFQEYAARLASLHVPIPQLGEKKKEKSVRVAGVIVLSKKIMTKNNEPMIFAKIEDGYGDIELVVFPRVYKENPSLWEADRIVVVSGRVQDKDGELKFLAETGYEVTPDNIDDIENMVKNASGVSALLEVPDEAEGEKVVAQVQTVLLQIRANMPETILLKVREVLEKYPGHYRVFFLVEQASGKQKVLSSYRISFNELISKEIEAVLGADTVRTE